MLATMRLARTDELIDTLLLALGAISLLIAVFLILEVLTG